VQPALLAGCLRVAQQGMIHGFFPLRGVPLKLPQSLCSELSLNPLHPL
jgi:hypothetical protein